MTSEGNQPAQCAGRFHSGLRGVPAGGDENLITPNLPQELVRVRVVVLVVVRASHTGFDRMKVSEVREPLLNLRDIVRKRWLRVLHPHPLPGTPR